MKQRFRNLNYLCLFLLILLIGSVSGYGDSSFIIKGYLQSSPWFYEPGYEMNCISLSTSCMAGLDLGPVTLGIDVFSEYMSFTGDKTSEELKGAWFNTGSNFLIDFSITPRINISFGAGFLWNQSSTNFNNLGWLSSGLPGLEITAASSFALPGNIDLEFKNKLDIFFSGDVRETILFHTGLRGYFSPGVEWLRLFSEINGYYWSFTNEIIPNKLSSWMVQAQIGVSFRFYGRINKNNDDDEDDSDVQNDTDKIDKRKIIIDEIITSDPGLMQLKNARIGEDILFYTINFNNEDLTPMSITVLDGMAKILKEDESFTISIKGYAELIMDPQKELELSRTRAVIIKKYLMLQGVRDHQIMQNPIGNIISDDATYIEITVITRALPED